MSIPTLYNYTNSENIQLFKQSVLICPSEFMPLVKCPKCGKKAEYNGNEFRPFCSERCKLIDFGAWVDGEYTLPTRETSLSEEDLDMIEKVLEEKAEL